MELEGDDDRGERVGVKALTTAEENSDSATGARTTSERRRPMVLLLLKRVIFLDQLVFGQCVLIRPKVSSLHLRHFVSFCCAVASLVVCNGQTVG